MESGQRSQAITCRVRRCLRLQLCSSSSTSVGSAMGSTRISSGVPVSRALQRIRLTLTTSYECAMVITPSLALMSISCRKRSAWSVISRPNPYTSSVKARNELVRRNQARTGFAPGTSDISMPFLSRSQTSQRDLVVGPPVATMPMRVALLEQYCTRHSAGLLQPPVELTQ
jgi:hypothetical protein